MRFSLLTLCAITAAFALPSHNAIARELNELGDPSDTVYASGFDGETRQAGCSTNAECLRLKLPLRPQAPRRRQAQNPAISALPVVRRRGRITVIKASDSSTVGYISNNLAPNNVYGVTQVVADAAEITIDSATGLTDLNLLSNADAAFPYLCLASGGGTDTLGPGLNSYGLVTACQSATAPDAAPTTPAMAKWTGAQAVETPVFTIDPATGILSAQWTNPDLSQPTTFLTYVAQTNILTYTGDVAAYQARFASAPRIEVRYRFDVDVV